MRARRWHRREDVRCDTVPDRALEHPWDAIMLSLCERSNPNASVAAEAMGHSPMPCVTDEQALFLSDIFPTGYMAAENCNLRGGGTVAIWGCSPVGQFAIRSAFMLGAARVIAIDRVPERLALAREGGSETIDRSKETVYDRLQDLTDGLGPDACIDALGTEAAPASGGVVSSHKVGVQDGPKTCGTFRDKQDGCTKVTIRP